MAHLNKNLILEKLTELNPSFAKDGVRLLGIFGSYARDNATDESDIDVLIETTPRFLKKYRGLQAYVKLEDIKILLEKEFNKKIDLVDKEGLLQHNNTYILQKAVYINE
jgi:predicted nucleotidyltransferase